MPIYKNVQDFLFSNVTPLPSRRYGIHAMRDNGRVVGGMFFLPCARKLPCCRSHQPLCGHDSRTLFDLTGVGGGYMKRVGVLYIFATVALIIPTGLQSRLANRP